MTEQIYDFRSDNVGGVAPELFEAMLAANAGAAAPYGDDDFTRAMTAQFRRVFEYDGLSAIPVSTGTGANAVALNRLMSLESMTQRIGLPQTAPPCWRRARR